MLAKGVVFRVSNLALSSSSVIHRELSNFRVVPVSFKLLFQTQQQDVGVFP